MTDESQVKALARVICKAVYKHRPNAGMPIKEAEAEVLAAAILAEGYVPPEEASE